jgi:N4-gp56 family major capsid protein
MIQRITELTKSEKGTRAVLTLVADLETDGVAGDDQLEGNEEEIKAYDLVVQIDQLRQANRHKGKMAEQASVVTFREQSRDVLSYWLADRMDQLGFLTLSGMTYDKTNRGAARAANSGFLQLDFAADVSAPTANRYGRWDATDGLRIGAAHNPSNADLTTSDTPTWAMLVDLKAYAKERYLRGIKGAGGEEIYHVFMTPTGMAKLRQDPDYLANARNAGVRGSSNELFAGASSSILVEGLMIHEFRHVYNTAGAPNGQKWGGGAVDGQRVIFAGAQALGMVDLGAPEWTEKGFDYDNQQAIAIAKMFGLLKPKFRSQIDAAVEDFGVICVDTAI